MGTESTEQAGEVTPAAEPSMTRAPVEDRGEFVLPLDGSEFGLRPSYNAINEFELATGRGLLELSRAAVNGQLTLTETAQIACACVKAWGEETGDTGAARAQTRRIAELMLGAPGGYRECARITANMLVLAVTGGYDSKGKLKPTTTTP